IGVTKTFSSAINAPSGNFTGTTNQFVLGTTNTTTISATAPAASAVYTIPDVGTVASFVMTAGSQTVNGAKTFGSAITAPSGTFTNTTNQFVLGTTNTTTVNATAPVASVVYTIPDTGANSSFIMTDGTQTINGATTFASGIAITATSSQIVLGGATTTTINAFAPAANRQYNLVDAGGNANIILSLGTQTIGGAKTFTSTINTPAVNNTSGTLTLQTTTSGDVTINPASGQVNVPSTINKASGTLTIQTSSAGDISLSPSTGNLNVPTTVRRTGAMTITTLTSGDITLTAASGTVNINASTATKLSGTLSVAATTNQIVLGTTNTTTITSPAPAASRTYTIPDTAANSSFVMTDLAQTLNGVKTFSSGIPITATTNQLVLGGATTTTISATAPAVSAVYTIPDVGTAANFVLTAGTQTINGAKTFGSAINAPSGNFTGTTNQFVLGTTNTTTISATAPAASAVYTIVDVGTSANFVMTAGTQTINGAKTFGSAISAPSASFTATTNQLILGSLKNITITAPAPAASGVYTIPDVGTTASFVMTAGNQTIAGTKTFSGTINMSALTV